MKRLILAFVVVAMVVGCAGMQAKSEEEVYLVAITQYNGLLGLYLRHEPRIDDQAIKDKIEQAFMAGNIALDTWLKFIRMDMSTASEQVKFDQALDLLLELIPLVIDVTEDYI